MQKMRHRTGFWLAGCAAALFFSGSQVCVAQEGSLAGAERYDREYPHVAYSQPATDNRIWRMQQRLDDGSLKLKWEPKFGYLRSLLGALEIDPSSQVLVFSSTSLQFSDISASNPRAVFFNDDTYVGFVPGTDLIEIAAIDAKRGAVFFALDNTQGARAVAKREGGQCLVCHDTYSMTGGGVPRVVVMSTPVDDERDTREWSAATETDDRTPLAQRWGGWFVTGHTGDIPHFGNLPLREQKLDRKLRELRALRNPATLDAYIDTSKHLTPHSDVVALLVLEHQTFVQNLVTRISWKAPQLMSAAGAAAGTWSEVDANDARRVGPMIEALVRALFLHEAAPLGGRIEGSNGFAKHYVQSGRKDAAALRELDLGGRLFRHRLSPLVHSAQLDALPPFARDYVYGRIVEVLDGRDTRGISASIPEAERAALRRILLDTHPAIAARLRAVSTDLP